MALQKQMVNIPFQKGIDTKLDDKHTLPTSPVTLENAEFDKIGSITKRPGFETVAKLDTNGYSMDKTVELIDSNGTLLALSRLSSNYYKALAYTNLDSSKPWKDIADYSPISFSTKPLLPTDEIEAANSVDTDNYTCSVAYTTSYGNYGRVMISIREKATNIEVGSWNFSRIHLLEPMVLAHNTKAMFILDIGNTIWSWTFDEASPTASPNFTSLGTPLDPTCPWDAINYGSYIYLAYADTSAKIAIDTYDFDGNTVSTLVDTGYTVESRTSTSDYGKACVSISVVNSRVEVLFFEWNYQAIAITKYFGSYLSTNIIFTPSSVIATHSLTHGDDGSYRRVYAAIGYAADDDRLYTFLLDAVDNIVSGSQFYISHPDYMHPEIVSRPIQTYEFVNSHIMINFRSTTQSFYALCSVREGYFYIESKIGTGNRLTQHHLVSPVTNSIGTTICLIKQERLAKKGTVLSSVHKYSFTHTTKPKSVDVGLSTFISGGQLYIHDSSFEAAGFVHSPQEIIYTQTGSSRTYAGKFHFKITYEKTNQIGEVSYSAPSATLDIETASGDNEVTLRLPTIKLGMSADEANKIKIRLWGRPDDGSVYYYLTTVQNDASVAFVDRIMPYYNDSTWWGLYGSGSLEDGEALYTTGGIIENRCPPSPKLILFAMNRLFLVSSDNPTTVFYSKEKMNKVNFEFSPALQQSIPLDSPITALAELDNKLLIFSKDSIYVLTGKAYNAFGQGQPFQAVKVPTQVGCINSNSMVGTKDGIMFKSSHGFYLFNRGMQVVRIGMAVDSYNGRTILDSIYSPKKDIVYFMLHTGIAATEDSIGVLCFDGENKQWSSYKFLGQESMRWTVGTFYNNLLVLNRNTPTIYNDMSTTMFEDGYMEDGSAYNFVLETGWIHLAGIDNFQRVYGIYINGTWKSPHQVTISVAYNYEELNDATGKMEPDYVESKTFEFLARPDLAGAEDYPVKFKPKRQKCNAVKIKISVEHGDFPGNGLQAASLAGIVIMAGMKTSYKNRRS